MKARKKGARFPLLYYRRTLDRVWIYSLVLGVVLLAVIRLPLLNSHELWGISSHTWALAAAVLAFSMTAYALVARNMAYVQARYDHVRVVTPFLRFNISYRRIRSIHSVLLQQLFPRGKASWAQSSFLKPFYGKTALVLEMRGYPLSPALLKFFLPAVMFSPRSAGFVLVIPDWMTFSMELDSLMGNWLQAVKKESG